MQTGLVHTTPQSLSPTTGDSATGHFAGAVPDKARTQPDAPITRDPGRDPARDVARQRLSRTGLTVTDTFTGKAVLPRDKKVDAAKRPHCSPRPKDNRPTGGRGGGKKKFNPWCR